MSGVVPGKYPDVTLGVVMAVLPGGALLSLYALALIVLASRLQGLRRGRGLQGEMNSRGGHE